jgi:hypothetical protein
MANTPGTPGTADYIWRGKTPGLMVYDRALSAQEVKQNYNALKNRFI